LLYYRAFTPEWQTELHVPDFWKNFDKWLDDGSRPPKALAFVETSHALKEIDLGARRAYCDWEMIERLRQDGFGMLLSDIQSFRTYAALLTARARFEILDRKFDKAEHTLQTGFTFSRHISEGPTVIQGLVGVSFTGLMLHELELLIQQPGAPNLYWALTDLPTPFIDLRKTMQGEKIVTDSLLPGWRDMVDGVDARAMTPHELDKLAKNFILTINLSHSRHDKAQLLATRFGLAAMAASSYPEARQFLLKRGRPAALVDEMPVLQVSFLYQMDVLDRFRDDMAKWYGLPYPQMRKGLAKASKALREAKANGKAGTTLAALLAPSVEKVVEASYRMDRKLACLRCVEAIRLYAAAHEGKLPPSLKDIDEVPVPVDPFTGSSFEYQVENDTAILTAGPPGGSEPFLGRDWTFEITMQP
jgi:hypothetical protein